MKHDPKHYSKRKQKSSKTTLIAIISIVVILAIVGLIFVKPLVEKNRYKTYNHFEFKQSGDYWQTRVQYNNNVSSITFYNHPLDIKNIYYNDNITSYILKEPHSAFIIAIKEDAGSIPVIGGINIARILGARFYGFKVSSALYSDDVLKNQSNTSLPTVSCADATPFQPIIFIDVAANEKSIDFSKENKNCIHIKTTSSQKEDVLPLADLFVYKILEIM